MKKKTGRPPIKSDEKTIRMGFTVNESLAKNFLDEVESLSISQSELFRIILERRYKGKSKHPSYRNAIVWVAENDEPLEMHTDILMDQISIILIADIFGFPPRKVAADVIRWRQRTT